MLRATLQSRNSRRISSEGGIALAPVWMRRQKMEERDPREDEQIEDRIDDENLVDKSDDVEEFEDVEEKDEEAITEE